MSLPRRFFSACRLFRRPGRPVRRQAFSQTAGPFRHGVASGDPLASRVILWTRLTPANPGDVIPVEWIIAEDPAMRRVLQRGLTYTNVLWDYTVKVDVQRLNPGQTYYYQFRGRKTPIRQSAARAPFRWAPSIACASPWPPAPTTPTASSNAYRQIANRSDLDFVTHLGDYIYEYANAQYGDGAATGRRPLPDKEITTLDDYRQRYANTVPIRTSRKPTVSIPGLSFGTITNPPTTPGSAARRTIPKAPKVTGPPGAPWPSKPGLNGCPSAKIPTWRARSIATSASAI